jgi:glucose/arabinose dehydrogenase
MLNEVPDYLTRVRDGDNYGWPWRYWGTRDPRVTIPEPTHAPLDGDGEDGICRQTNQTPDYALGSHTASLGLAFYSANSFPSKFHGGAFIGQHGSWNRNLYSGYKVRALVQTFTTLGK